jgi:serine/threonine-protein kinase
MPALVTLTILQGSSTERQFVFDDRTTSLIGKEEDCQVRFPKDREHQQISRHHCLLDINPPDVRIRDLGSRNGTFVNGKLIGKRSQDQSREDAAQLQLAEVDLHDGDEIQLGGQGTVRLRVSVAIPAICASCSAEIPQDEQVSARLAPGQYQCAACRSTKVLPQRLEATRILGPRCARCGSDVRREMGWQRTGEFVCARCKADPNQIVNRLLEESRLGHESLRAIQGYRILKELGRGGMGAVYLVAHERTGEEVALKMMLPQVAASPKAQEMFLREAANSLALRHPNIVQVQDLGCSQGVFFFTLEYCSGGSVAQLMQQRGGPLPIDEAVPIILQALAGLEYAHQAELPQIRLEDASVGRGRGLVHRDIKPQNIFLSGTGSNRLAKVGDYGLAKAFDLAGLSGMSATGALAGTPVFMPRQQVIKFKYARPEVDVWAAAASLYYLLTGDYPRPFSSLADPWQVVLQTDAVPIRKRNPAIPGKLAEVIDSALVDNPEIQIKSAAQLRRALENAL